MRHLHKARTRYIIACMSLAFAGTASAGIPVIDIANDASNIIQNVQLAIISHQLGDRDKGTVNYYNNNISNNSSRISILTKNIDASSTNIDNSTTKIDKSTTSIDKSTTNIDIKTVSIEKTTTLNYAIDADFTWIINKSDNEIIPIPAPIKAGFEAIRNNLGTEAYIANYKSAETYKGEAGLNQDHETSGLEGSRARKAANDMLVKSLDTQLEGLEGEGKTLADMTDRISKSQGHGNQLQVANALAGSQVDQTMKLRYMLLAAESARAAEAQALADQDARAIATAKQLRVGLPEFLRSAKPRAPSY